MTLENNANGYLYAMGMLQTLDLTVDWLRQYNEPNIQHYKELLYPVLYLSNIFNGDGSPYIPALSAAVIAVDIYNGELQKAAETVAYSLLPTLLPDSGWLSLSYKRAMILYAGYKALNNLYQYNTKQQNREHTDQDNVPLIGESQDGLFAFAQYYDI
jgi:hypothetical protein